MTREDIELLQMKLDAESQALKHWIRSKRLKRQGELPRNTYKPIDAVHWDEDCQKY